MSLFVTPLAAGPRSRALSEPFGAVLDPRIKAAFRAQRPQPAHPRAATFPDDAARSTLVSEEGSVFGSRLR
jgi:hypothetical protein